MFATGYIHVIDYCTGATESNFNLDLDLVMSHVTPKIINGPYNSIIL